MFTGIVTDIGEVTAVEPRAEGLTRLSIACSYDTGHDCDRCLDRLQRRVHHRRGARPRRQSQLVCGRCRRRDAAAHDRRPLARGRSINLERSLKVGDELGGHIVAGHADGLAALVARENLTEMARLSFGAPPALARFIAPKGSVALDGVSLTVNEVIADHFSMLIIPHTLAVTTIGALALGENQSRSRSDGALCRAADGDALTSSTGGSACVRPAPLGTSTH